jgi:hypothetical protein
MAPLVGEGGVGHHPAVVHAAHHVVLGAAGAVEEDLVELGRAVGLGDGPHLHPGLLHRHEQVGDALVLGSVGVGAGEEEHVVGELGLRGPHLLAVDHPLVAVEHGGGLEAGEVGAAVGLAEALAPPHLAPQDLGQELCFCSSVPHWRMVGPTRVSPKKSARSGARARANSSASTTPSMVERPLPPYSFGQVAQIQPPAYSFFGHSSLKRLRSSPSSARSPARTTRRAGSPRARPGSRCGTTRPRAGRSGPCRDLDPPVKCFATRPYGPPLTPNPASLLPPPASRLPGQLLPSSGWKRITGGEELPPGGGRARRGRGGGPTRAGAVRLAGRAGRAGRGRGRRRR